MRSARARRQLPYRRGEMTSRCHGRSLTRNDQSRARDVLLLGSAQARLGTLMAALGLPEPTHALRRSADKSTPGTARTHTCGWRRTRLECSRPIAPSSKSSSAGSRTARCTSTPIRQAVVWPHQYRSSRRRSPPRPLSAEGRRRAPVRAVRPCPRRQRVGPAERSQPISCRSGVDIQKGRCPRLCVRRSFGVRPRRGAHLPCGPGSSLRDGRPPAMA